MTAKNGNEVRVEKWIKKPAREVFRAIAEGRLFNNCGAANEHITLDFRVGGRYRLGFKNAEMNVCGKFLEIVPDQLIRFTWGDSGSDPGFPFTDVSIEFVASGDQTRVVVVHKGFKIKEEADEHQFGWNAGLDDLTPELVDGKIRLVRVYPASREELFRVVSDVRKVFASVSDPAKGELELRVEELVPGKKMILSWLSGFGERLEKPTRLTLLFDDEEDGESSLELTHEFLPPEATKAHRQGWEAFLKGIYGRLKA